MNKLFTLMVAVLVAFSATALAPQILSDNHAMLRVDATGKYLLLPVQEKEENAYVRVIVNNEQVQTLNVRFAVDKVDYYVPLDIQRFGNKKVLVDISFHGDRRTTGAVKDFVCWREMRVTDTFDDANRERFRPAYHHTPAYGWMNDPNGMFYKDGVWHLYYQFNPYGSQWENMTWGHSTSTDLIHWTHQPIAIEPDALGTIFSGSCVTDGNDVVAIYTSAGQNQTQSIAISHDNGMTFDKYEGNPVLTSDVPDFRDPNPFWNSDINAWNLILAAGQEMNIYSSKDLKNWKYESSFGKEYGNHGGVWECPDLMKIDGKWVLLCNINPGGPFGGSATQYFVGDFDGHKFTCESMPKVTKWMDYGKDHYATVSFYNAPAGRHVVIAWMSNWQYANQAPTKQYRSANSIARDLQLLQLDGETYLVSTPSPENLAARGKAVKKGSISGNKVVKNLLKTNDGAYELTADLDMQKADELRLTLFNNKGQEVAITFDTKKKQYSVDRTKSGTVDFSDDFPCTTTAPLPDVGNYGLRLFVDKLSIEVFVDPGFGKSGLFPMTNLVFPSEPYNHLRIENLKGSSKVKDVTVYPLK